MYENLIRPRNSSDILLPHGACGSAHASQVFTKEEKRIIKVLKALPKEPIIGHCIHNTLDNAVRADLRQLISELKDQLRDAPENTTQYLGEEATQLLNAYQL